MIIDLDQLHTRHPELAVQVASNLCFNAALALQRRHKPGVSLSAQVRGAKCAHVVTWQLVPEAARAQVDEHRETEDGAEAIALGLAHEACRWVVRRRLQRRQRGDWLLVELGSDRRVVFEVGGLDTGSLTTKLKGELAQVRQSPLPYDRAACVVRFADVQATLVIEAYPCRAPSTSSTPR
jgi:hypothetical protein